MPLTQRSKAPSVNVALRLTMKPREIGSGQEEEVNEGMDSLNRRCERERERRKERERER